MKRYLKRLIPRSFFILASRMELRRVDKRHCDDAPLARINRSRCDSIFSSEVCQKEWEHTEKEIAPLAIPESGGGVNPGDRRAIYSLIRNLAPTSVLEVGTHIGVSMVYIAAALKRLRALKNDDSYKLVTVDVRDVNDPVSKPWLKFGSKHAPIEMVERIGCRDLVTFCSSDSLSFFANSKQKYDFIFLDGSHAASTVYREIPEAMRLLRSGGHILLHDYFPELRPLWPHRPIVPGPYLATRRLQQEGAPIEVVPLGRLPWLTKSRSNVTSLALLGKKSVPYSMIMLGGIL